MKERLHIKLPIIVEGRYDKARLTSVADAHIITTEGFGIFRETEKKELIRRLASKGGVIVLTDSDGAGLVIRGYLKRILPPGSIHNLYIPPTAGKERRKEAPSKEGLLGVEGMDCDILYDLLLPFSDESTEAAPDANELTKAEFYSDGFSGGKDSAARRLMLCEYLSLPKNLSANALLEAVNMLGLRGGYESFLKKNSESGNDIKDD